MRVVLWQVVRGSVTFSCSPSSSVARLAGSEQAEALQSGLDDAVDRMRALATNRGDTKRRSKQDRARLKGSFRELCNAVEVRGARVTGPEGSTCVGCITVGGRLQVAMLKAKPHVSASKAHLRSIAMLWRWVLGDGCL